MQKLVLKGSLDQLYIIQTSFIIFFQEKIIILKSIVFVLFILDIHLKKYIYIYFFIIPIILLKNFFNNKSFGKKKLFQ